MNQLTDQLNARGVGFDNLISGVKNFLPANKSLPVTRLVEAIMDPTTAETQAVRDTEEWLFFDPRSGRSRAAGTSGTRSKATFNDALVFVVGGGGYVEYSDLVDWATRSSTVPAGTGAGYAAGPGKKRITYGSTEIFSGTQFLQSLGNLAKTGQ